MYFIDFIKTVKNSGDTFWIDFRVKLGILSIILRGIYSHFQLFS